jgi:hypothetical protein
VQTYVLNPRPEEYETYDLESNPRRLPARSRSGRFMRRHHNPSRRRRHRRHSYSMVRHHNPSHRRYRLSTHHRRRYRRNPSIEQITGGVGIGQIVGVGAGFVAASEGPLLFGLTHWKNVAASAAIAIVGGKVLEGIWNRATGMSFIAGGVANAGLKALGIVTNGQFGITAGSPQIHNVFGPISAAAQAQHRALPARIPAAGAAVQSAPVRLPSPSGL